MNIKRVANKVSLWLQSLLYIGAGINHFINPASYVAMIPPAIPYKSELNWMVGAIELILGILLIVWVKHRKIVSLAIIFMLIAFIPAHVYHIQMNGNIPGCELVLPIWGTWVRLFMQLILIAWAWSIRKS